MSPASSSDAVSGCLARSPTTTFLAQCRNGTAGQPSAGDGQLLLGPIIALGPFLRPFEMPYGHMPVSISVLQCSDCLHCCPFIRDLLMLRYGLYFFWICLQIRGLHFRGLNFFQGVLRILWVGLPLFSLCLHFYLPGIHFGQHPFHHLVHSRSMRPDYPMQSSIR
jgi:hypothetical protein